jgi:hypothetical protein
VRWWGVAVRLGRDRSIPGICRQGVQGLQHIQRDLIVSDGAGRATSIELIPVDLVEDSPEE